MNAPLFHELLAAIAQAAISSAGLGILHNRLNPEHDRLWKRAYLCLRELERMPIGMERKRGAA